MTDRCRRHRRTNAATTTTPSPTSTSLLARAFDILSSHQRGWAGWARKHPGACHSITPHLEARPATVDRRRFADRRVRLERRADESRGVGVMREEGVGVMCRTVDVLSRAGAAGLLHGDHEERRVAQPGEVHLRRATRSLVCDWTTGYAPAHAPRERHPPRHVCTGRTSPPVSHPGVKKASRRPRLATSNYRVGTSAAAPTAGTAARSPPPSGGPWGNGSVLCGRGA